MHEILYIFYQNDVDVTEQDKNKYVLKIIDSGTSNSNTIGRSHKSAVQLFIGTESKTLKKLLYGISLLQNYLHL